MTMLKMGSCKASKVHDVIGRLLHKKKEKFPQSRRPRLFLIIVFIRILVQQCIKPEEVHFSLDIQVK
jgi:hypothetical protein